MSNHIAGRSAAEFAAGLLVCGAVHYFLIAPTRRQAAAAHAEADKAATARTSGAAVSAERLTEMAIDSRKQAARVNELNRVALDETELFAQITRLADSTGVRVDQLEPVQRAQPTPPPPPPPPTAGPGAATPLIAAKPPMTTVESALTVTGSYGGIAAFLHGLAGDTGFTVVKTVRIDPGERHALVRARITAEHFAFVVPPAVVAGAGDAPTEKR